MIMSSLRLLLLLSVSTTAVTGFVSSSSSLWFSTSSTTPTTTTTTTTLASSASRDNDDKVRSTSASSFLTASDWRRLQALKERHVTLPILILEQALVPNQCLTFQTTNSHLEDQEIAVIGLNPNTGHPLSSGVIARVKNEFQASSSSSTTSILSLEATSSRVEVQGEPYRHNSFYLADLEIINDRSETMSREEKEKAEELAKLLPIQVTQWKQQLLRSFGSSFHVLDLSSLPSFPSDNSWTDQAMWVAALVNPTSPHIEDNHVCMEVRPAMLAAQNDYQRLLLASAALQNSMQYMSSLRRK